MSGVAARVRRYVEVISHTSIDGVITPLEIVWRDGSHYSIDRVISSQRAHARRVGGTGIRYLIRIRSKETCLWYEGPRWFVEEKVAPNNAQELATTAWDTREDSSWEDATHITSRYRHDQRQQPAYPHLAKAKGSSTAAP